MGGRKNLKIQGGLQKRGVFQSVLPSPSDLYNHTASHFATGMEVGEKLTSGTVSKSDAVPDPSQTPRMAPDFSGVLQRQLQWQNRAPESVTSQNSENEKPRVLAARTLDFLIEGSVISP